MIRVDVIDYNCFFTCSKTFTSEQFNNYVFDIWLEIKEAENAEKALNNHIC